jgi:hypothetical protein
MTPCAGTGDVSGINGSHGLRRSGEENPGSALVSHPYDSCRRVVEPAMSICGSVPVDGGEQRITR